MNWNNEPIEQLSEFNHVNFNKVKALLDQYGYTSVSIAQVDAYVYTLLREDKSFNNDYVALLKEEIKTYSFVATIISFAVSLFAKGFKSESKYYHDWENTKDQLGYTSKLTDKAIEIDKAIEKEKVAKAKAIELKNKKITKYSVGALIIFSALTGLLIYNHKI